MTQVSCAEMCARANYTTAGVEYRVACFCGDVADGKKGIGGNKLPIADCGGPTGLGAGDMMLVYPFACTLPLPPGPPPPPPPPPPISPTMARTVVSAYEEMIKLLLDFTTTPGTLGMLAAHEGDNYFSFNRHGIPLGVVPNNTFNGTPRVYRPAVRTVVSKDEKMFELQAAVLSAAPPTTVKLTIQGMSGKPSDVRVMALVRDARTGEAHSQLYGASLPMPQEEFSYVVTAEFGAPGAPTKTLSSPSTGTQSVVVV
jgi:hypothetical protein